jgi:hypothetical protein
MTWSVALATCPLCGAKPVGKFCHRGLPIRLRLQPVRAHTGQTGRIEQPDLTRTHVP